MSDGNNILSVVKTIKYVSPLDLTCNSQFKLSQVQEVEQKFQIEASDKKIETLTNEELKMAAEIFMYLTICPDSVKPWLAFYKDLFQSQSPSQIILTLNRLLKGSKTPENEHHKILAESLFQKIVNIIPKKAGPPTILEGISAFFEY